MHYAPQVCSISYHTIPYHPIHDRICSHILCAIYVCVDWLYLMISLMDSLAMPTSSPLAPTALMIYYILIFDWPFDSPIISVMVHYRSSSTAFTVCSRWYTTPTHAYYQTTLRRCSPSLSDAHMHVISYYVTDARAWCHDHHRCCVHAWSAL